MAAPATSLCMLQEERLKAIYKALSESNATQQCELRLLDSIEQEARPLVPQLSRDNQRLMGLSSFIRDQLLEMRSNQKFFQRNRACGLTILPATSLTLTHVLATKGDTSPFTWAFVETLNALVAAGCYTTLYKSYTRSKTALAKIDELTELFNIKQTVRPLQQALLAPEAGNAYSLSLVTQNSSVNIPHRIPNLIVTPAELIRDTDETDDETLYEVD